MWGFKMLSLVMAETHKLPTISTARYRMERPLLVNHSKRISTEVWGSSRNVPSFTRSLKQATQMQIIHVICLKALPTSEITGHPYQMHLHFAQNVAILLVSA